MKTQSMFQSPEIPITPKLFSLISKWLRNFYLAFMPQLICPIAFYQEKKRG